MSNAKSGTIVCAECGEENRATARFCTACAARLGAEPSAAGATASNPMPLRQESRREALGATPSRPIPLTPPAADSATFLFKFCIAGLVVLIGFIGWALYMLTASRAVPAAPASQSGISSAEPMAIAPPVAASAEASTQSQGPATQGAPARAAPDAPPARAAAPTENYETFPEIRRPAPMRRQATRERPPRPGEGAPEVATSDNWTEPTRPPASTSSPLYQDPGPPIVPGPGPRESALSTLPSVPVRSGGAAIGRSADPGPPIAEGPGPHYDYSTPGAAGR